MIRLLLVLAVVALGADALFNSGSYTQSAWRKLSSYEVNISPDRDRAVEPEKRS
jgi:hypothetical protein